MRQSNSGWIGFGLLLGFCLLRVVVSLWYAAYLPAFERFDEAYHYQVIRTTIQERRIVNASDAPPVSPALQIYQQFDQPPLYYLLLSPLVALWDTEPVYDIQSTGQSACLVDQLHSYTHPLPNPAIRNGLFAARAATIFLTTLVLVPLWITARILQPQNLDLAIVVAITYTFLPAALSISIWVNNDSLLMLWGACGLLLYVRRISGLWQRRDTIALWCICMAALLTKLNGLAVIPLCLLHLRPHKLPRFGLFFAAVGLVAITLLGCQLGFCRIHRYQLPFDTWNGFLYTLRPGLYLSSFQNFLSDFLMPTPRPQLTSVPDLLLIAIGILWGLGWLRAGSQQLYKTILKGCLLLIVSSIGLALLRIWWLQVDYFAARYIAIAFPALCLIWAIGIHRTHLRLLLVPLILISVVNPVWLSRPLIHRTMPLSALPDNTTITDYTFENGMAIGGYDLLEPHKLRIYWHTDKQLAEPYFAIASLYNADNLLEQCWQFVGGGWLSSETWQTDEWIPQDFTFANLSQATHFDVTLYPMRKDLPPPMTFFDAQNALYPHNPQPVALLHPDHKN